MPPYVNASAPSLSTAATAAGAAMTGRPAARGSRMARLRFLMLLTLSVGLVYTFCSFMAERGGGNRGAAHFKLVRDCRRRDKDKEVVTTTDLRLMQNSSDALIAHTNLSALSSLTDTVFFVETNPRTAAFFAAQECAFESAALRNPKRQVVVLLPEDSAMASSSRHLAAVGNLRFAKVDFRSLTQGTSVEGLWNSSLSANTSGHHLHVVSDVIRAVLLYHFGGAYLDSDVISRKPFPELVNGVGVAVAEKDERVNNAVLGFAKDSDFVKMLLREQKSRLSGPDDWGVLGPAAVTRVAQRVCHPKTSATRSWWRWPIFFGGGEERNLLHQDCGRYLKILPHSAAYPVDYEDWRAFFLPESDSEVTAQTEKSFAVHLWNQMRRWGDGEGVTLCGDAPVARLMRENCPRTAAAKLDKAIGRPYGEV